MINFRISSNEIGKILNLNIEFDDERYFQGISTIDQVVSNTVIFIKNINEESKSKILELQDCLIITQDSRTFPFQTIKVSNSRLAMAKVLGYVYKKMYKKLISVSPNAIVSSDAIIGNNVVIEDFVFIDSGVKIGDNVQIKCGAKILKNCTIGNNCIIRENTVIGGQGFGVEKDENGNNYKIQHLGGVCIHDNVEIGALNTVVSGTINPTIIEEYVKTGDHVHIAHNCHIKRNAIITAGVILSGSVTIGENVWIGPNSTIKNSLVVGDNNLIGIGTVITRIIEDTNNTYAGVPGKKLNDFINERKAFQFLVENIEKIKDKL